MELKLFESELKVMEELWENGDLSASQLVKILKEKTDWNRNTTYTVIKKCIQKGAIMIILKIYLAASPFISIIILMRLFVKQRISHRIYVILYNMAVIRLVLKNSFPFPFGFDQYIKNKDTSFENLLIASKQLNTPMRNIPNTEVQTAINVSDITDTMVNNQKALFDFTALEWIWMIGVFFIGAVLFVKMYKSYQMLSQSILIKNYPLLEELKIECNS